jgi:hypothetical protein
MSIPVPLERLRAAVDERGPHAYVVTVSDDGRPHVVHAAVRWQDGRLASEVGRRSLANAIARPAVSLLFPVRGAHDYSLIVDGTAAVDEQRLVVTPTKGVLHRPAAAPDPTASGCAADCVPLLSAPRRRD